jgi:hypothetical protein
MLRLVHRTDDLESAVELIARGGHDAVLIEVDDPGKALSALSALATEGPALPQTRVALRGEGAADLVYALRRLGLRAEQSDGPAPPIAD